MSDAMDRDASRFAVEWPADKVARLRIMHGRAVKQTDMAAAFGVSQGAVQRQLRRMGLVKARVSGADRRDQIAEAVANGATIAQAAQRAGISVGNARWIWRQIVKDLGWQAQ